MIFSLVNLAKRCELQTPFAMLNVKKMVLGALITNVINFYTRFVIHFVGFL